MRGGNGAEETAELVYYIERLDALYISEYEISYVELYIPEYGNYQAFDCEWIGDL